MRLGQGSMLGLRRRLLWTILALGYCCVVLPSKAHAYLDPGTGSLIIQMVAGAVLAGGMTVKLWWGHVKSFTSRILRSRKGEGDAAE